MVITTDICGYFIYFRLEFNQQLCIAASIVLSSIMYLKRHKQLFQNFFTVQDIKDTNTPYVE